MCETDRDHRATTALYVNGGRNRRRNNRETNGNHHVNGRDPPATHEPPESPYKVQVSIRFVVTSLLASCLLAFCVGRAARIVVLRQVARKSGASLQERCDAPLPSLIVKNGKNIPQTRYSSKNFDTSMSASSSSWLAVSRDPNGQDSASLLDHDVTDDQEPQPMAEHLMVDIKHVESAFLNSEGRLANAIIEVVNEAKLTLLSYHCHGLVPMGVSCVGVLKQNYISFHTWPEEGVITFDLCVGGSRSLLPVLPIIERAFGKPRAHGEKPETVWAHRIRGFPADESVKHDLGVYVLGDLATDVKREIASVETNYQKLDIYEVKELNNVRPEASLLQRKSQDARHAVVLKPDRVVMRDGWVESTLFHEAAYHEALVHPALFAHANPKRVTIIGGGEGASLREALKHKTLEEAVLLEIDEKIVNLSKEYMPEWSDCSDLNGSASWCFDDPRTKVHHVDALKWFVDRYSSVESAIEPMDIIIMNALGAESETAYADALYSNVTFMQSFYNSLSDDGILVMQLGESPDSYGPDEMSVGDNNRVAATSLLETVGFESFHVYEESHCGFGTAWTFIVALKSYSSRKLWFANLAEIELAIRKRIVTTKSGREPLRYFDGATMVSYQIPSRTIENVFCRRHPTPLECYDSEGSFDPAVPNAPVSSFEVKVSGQGEKAGRGIFTTIDIANETYIAAETGPQALHFPPSTVALIMELTSKFGEEAEGVEVLEYYMFGYGFASRKHGTMEVRVDSSILTFANHGCRGSNNVGERTHGDEFSVDLNAPDESINGKSHSGTSVFNPFIDRHLFFAGDESIRDIEAGEEILDNYLAFIGGTEYWAQEVLDIQKQCSGEVTEGSVTDYEELYSTSRK